MIFFVSHFKRFKLISFSIFRRFSAGSLIFYAFIYFIGHNLSLNVKLAYLMLFQIY